MEISSHLAQKKILMRAGETDQAQILNKNKYDIFSKKFHLFLDTSVTLTVML